MSVPMFAQYVPQVQPTSVANVQQSVPVAPQTNGAGANITSSGGLFESATSERFADRVFNPQSDSIDFEKGTFTWKGKSFDIGNARVVKARFERYLSMPQSSSSYTNYQSIISEIESNLAASNNRLDYEKLRPVWLRLFDAAEYDVDGGACVSIANLVFLSWRMRGEINLNKTNINEIAGQKRNAEFLLNSATMKMEWSTDNHAKVSPKGGKVPISGKGALAEKIKKVQEKTAELVAAEAKSEMMSAKAVLQFQSQILIFMLERKFQEAQIASMFYRHIYRGSVQDFKSGSKELFSTFDSSTFVPTIDSVESLANDARKDIRDGMAAVENLYSTNNRYSAMLRLLETFALGENDPALVAFDSSKRSVLLEIYKSLSTLKELAETRDFDEIEQCVSQMQNLAKDFPAREIMAKVKAAKNASNMYVSEARLAAFNGKLDDSKKALVEAAKIWPLNPEIKKFESEAMNVVVGSKKYSEKFDDCLKNKDYRAIVKEAQEYALAMRNEPEKIKELKTIVENITKLDAYIAQAREMIKQKNYYIAWDVLETARSIYPDDPVLANERATLAPEVADYVKLLNRAKEAQNASRYAEALNCYLAAQVLSPTSSECRKGIEETAPKYAE